MDEGSDGVEGIEHSSVTDWLEQHADAVQPPLRFEIIAGGHSNLTYRVTDAAGSRWVLRRPPLGHVLEGAHDMVREHRLLSSLGRSAVPVPPVVGLCTDHAVNGADFYVTDFVDGHILRNPESAAALDAAARERVGRELMSGLAAIHAVDLDEVGLADLGRREDYVARQLRTWLRAFGAMTSRELPIIEEVHGILASRIPEQQGATLVHGDYRLDNCLVTSNGGVAAVLDWEIATLGDPVADLGITLAYWCEAGDGFLPLGEAATTEPGFAARDELTSMYADLTGRDTSDVGYYYAFANWRLACILEGVHSRYMGGAKTEIPPEVSLFPRSVEQLAERAHELLAAQ